MVRGELYWARLRGQPHWVFDGVVAVLLFAADLWFNFGLIERGRFADDLAGYRPGWVIVACLAVGTLPIAFRRYAPWPVFGIVATAAVIGTVAHLSVSELGVLAALFTVAGRAKASWTLLALAAFAIPKLAVDLTQSAARPYVFVLALGYLLAWMLGRQCQIQRRLAVAGERARIARELHDVVAHSTSVMVLQVAAARRNLGCDVALADAALTKAESLGRASLTELRELVGVLRDGSDGVRTPGLVRLDDLIGQFRDTGLAVRLTVSGESRPVSPMLDQCVYRIVQEALTNTLRHANARTAGVRLHYGDRRLRVQVFDDGTGAAVGQNGHGVLGMRERASLVGGRLVVGNGPGGGFRVDALLPVGAGDD